ncbi:MAG: Coq4 family protein [Myxococcota bacterium]|nr:Coq4 family protein [Myxococcota bacterium]
MINKAPSDRRPRNPLRLREAWQALRKLLADPDRTDHVFTIIDALSGNSGEKQFRRFAATQTGIQILREERDILPLLSNRDALHALPEGSLGHTYAHFMENEQISADGLASASEEGSQRIHEEEDPNRLRFGTRLRDTHDLWHVTTGYNRDLVGEASLLAFTFAQIRNPGIGAIVAMAYLHSGDSPDARKMIRQAYRRGRKASWLPGADWEALLGRPLDEVRAELGIQDQPPYSEMRSAAGELALKSQ